MPRAVTPDRTWPCRVLARLSVCREAVSDGKALARALGLLFVVACLCVFPGRQALAAEDAEAGLPLTQVFSPAEYGGGGQNWALVQDKRGLIYVGNGDDGVLEFDGVRWRRIPVLGRIVRSLAVADDGRIYVGLQGEIGYLAPDANQTLVYKSLLDRVPADAREFSDVWQTLVVGRDVYFSTPQALFRLRAGAIRVWKSEEKIHLSFTVRGRVYSRKFGKGLYELQDDELRLVPGGERFAEERIYAMLPWTEPGQPDRGEVLIGTRSLGWQIFDGRHYRPWKTQIDEATQQRLLYGALWTSAGDLAMGTLEGGMAVLDRTGKQRLHMDRKAGLGDDIVYSQMEDNQHGLWFALGTGVSRVATSGNLSTFDARNGLVGAILNIHRHRGQLYVGTHAGLFHLVTRPGTNPHFEQIPGLRNMTWDFMSVGDILLVSNLHGVYELREGKPARRVLETNGDAMTMLRSRLDPDRVFVGTALGVTAMRLQGDAWVQEPLALATGSGTYSFAEDARGRVWMGGQGMDVSRLTFPGLKVGLPLPASRLERFGKEQGLPPAMTYVSQIGGEIAFASADGFMRFDEASGRFKPAPEFSKLFGSHPRQVGPAREDSKGRVWLYSVDHKTQLKETAVAVRDPRGDYRWQAGTLPALDGISLQAIHIDPDGVVWLASETTVYRHTPDSVPAAPASFQALVRRVLRSNGTVIYGGAGGTPLLELPHDSNALRFEFAAPRFDRPKATQYQVWLEGVDTGWSEWSTEGYRDYTKIPIGPHRFRVRARDAFGHISREAVSEFRLLPPWYLTWWAFLGYAVTLLALLWSVLEWRSAALRKRNAELAELVSRRTQELSSANGALQEANQALAEQSVTDPLTGLKNRRHVMQQMDMEIAQVDRRFHPAGSGERGGLLFLLIDIDHFKEVNDRYGHAAGDRVLEQFRDILVRVCRRTDTPVRWGGEEFLVLGRATSAQDGAILAERVRCEVAAHAFDLGNGLTLHRTCSIGFASYPLFAGTPGCMDWEQIVHLADECLYAAKHNGRNTWFGVVGAGDEPPADLVVFNELGVEELVAAGHLQWVAGRSPGARSLSGSGQRHALPDAQAAILVD